MGATLGQPPRAERGPLFRAGGLEAQWLLFKIDSWKVQVVGKGRGRALSQHDPGTGWKRTE